MRIFTKIHLYFAVGKTTFIKLRRNISKTIIIAEILLNYK